MTTPIQLDMTAAHTELFFTPHIIKKIDGDSIKVNTTVRKTSISPKHFEPVIEGMFDVYKKELQNIYRKGIEICGKLVLLKISLELMENKFN